jgi:hypothetical protein
VARKERNLYGPGEFTMAEYLMAAARILSYVLGCS